MMAPRGLVDGCIKREKGGLFFFKGVWKGLVLFFVLFCYFSYMNVSRCM